VDVAGGVSTIAATVAARSRRHHQSKQCRRRSSAQCGSRWLRHAGAVQTHCRCREPDTRGGDSRHESSANSARHPTHTGTRASHAARGSDSAGRSFGYRPRIPSAGARPASRRATLCCGPSNNASSSLIPSEDSSPRIRNRARSDSDATIGPFSASIATLSRSVRSVMVTPD
jgi:hypothetical protein